MELLRRAPLLRLHLVALSRLPVEDPTGLPIARSSWQSLDDASLRASDDLSSLQSRRHARSCGLVKATIPIVTPATPPVLFVPVSIRLHSVIRLLPFSEYEWFSIFIPE